MRTGVAILVAVVAMACAGSAHAVRYRVLPASTLAFTATYQGEAFEGRFARFTPVIEFDPAHLDQSRFDVAIDLASADTRNSERDEMLHGEGFFNSGKQARAHYLCARFRALGGGRYVADGVLELNGVRKPVPLSFTWSAGAKPMLVGSATLKRLDFGVGTGEWTDTELLPNAVRVSTRLLLAPAPR